MTHMLMLRRAPGTEPSQLTTQYNTQHTDIAELGMLLLWH